MNAGRELDKLVAEKVMELAVQEFSNPMDCDVCHKTFYFEDSIKPYSTDIAAAWEVVEALTDWNPNVHDMRFKLVRPDSAFTGFAGASERSSRCYEATFSSGGGKYVVRALTAPHAICLAALKAKGVEV